MTAFHFDWEGGAGIVVRWWGGSGMNLCSFQDGQWREVQFKTLGYVPSLEQARDEADIFFREVMDPTWLKETA